MKIDFSPLVKAIQNNDSARVNKLTKALYERLVTFLRYEMNANIVDAEDCVQDALITAFRIVRTGKLKDPTSFYPYVRTICRNNFLTMNNKKKVAYLEEMYVDIFQTAPQIQHLLDKEKTTFLIWCFNQLQEKNQDFIKYWYDHPNIKAQKVADHFGISLSNAWTKKHRLIRKLHECHKRKRNL